MVPDVMLASQGGILTPCNTEFYYSKCGLVNLHSLNGSLMHICKKSFSIYFLTVLSNHVTIT